MQPKLKAVDWDKVLVLGRVVGAVVIAQRFFQRCWGQEVCTCSLLK